MILILGLNPVWQKVLSFEKFQDGQVNRATSQVSFASGKGINMVRALNQLNLSSSIIQPIGGQTGRQFLESAKPLANLFSIPISGATRTCTTCLDGQGGATEIIEPSPILSLIESQTLLELIASKVQSAHSIILAGTIPEGIDLEQLATVLKDINVMLDNFQQLTPLLKNGVGTSLKINARELKQLVGVTGIEGISKLLSAYPHLQNIAITNEAEATFLYTASKFYEIRVDGNWPLINPIGAGDTSSAVWTHYLSQGLPVLDAFVKSQAAARASCFTKVPGEFSPILATEIEQKIAVRLRVPKS